MRQFEVTVTLPAPPAAIWQHMSDVVRWPEWMETFQSITPLQARELALERRFTVRQPRLSTAVWTVTQLEPLAGFSWESRFPGLRMIADHWIEPRDTGARVQLRFAFDGLFSALASVLLGRRVRNYLQLECAAYQRRLSP